LVAKYRAGAATFVVSKEYGYRGGELLVTMSSGDGQRRRCLGSDGMEKLLTQTLSTAKREQALRDPELKRVNVDTTVQEKAVAFPTEARLSHKARRALVRRSSTACMRPRSSAAGAGCGGHEAEASPVTDQHRAVAPAGFGGELVEAVTQQVR
jgi:hypothetical protein